MATTSDTSRMAEPATSSGAEKSIEKPADNEAHNGKMTTATAEAAPQPSLEAAEKPKDQPTAASTTATTTTTTTNKTTNGPQATPAPSNGDAAAGIKPLPSATGTFDETNPPDFAGEVETNNEIPSQATLKKLENHTVLDASGKSHPFKSLYTGKNVPRRVLIIFIRHFFCGNCQEYLRTLAKSITPEALLRLPVPTFIAVVGCGASQLIDTYIAETGCPFPVYADETQKLYKDLGMVKTWQPGSRPAYMQKKHLGHTVVSGIMQGLKQVKTGLVMRMGDQRQVGGEFLFEPATASLESPIMSPKVELEQLEKTTAAVDLDAKDDGYGGHDEEKRITWCHRMRTTRDHAEVPELMEVLGLDGEGQPVESGRRWEKALRERKGTGISLASQMSVKGSAPADAKHPVEGDSVLEGEHIMNVSPTTAN